MKKQSAGILAYKIDNGELKVLIAHIGGPWLAKKDKNAWSIPKGEYDDTENAIDAARREFMEELNIDPPTGEYIELGSIEQKNNKTVTAWAVEADLDVLSIKSNTMAVEWPPKSGKFSEYPEIDRAEYFNYTDAKEKLVSGQPELIERLANKLGIKLEDSSSEKPEQSSLF